MYYSIHGIAFVKLQELSHLNVVEHPLESAPACAGRKFFYIKEDGVKSYKYCNFLLLEATRIRATSTTLKNRPEKSAWVKRYWGFYLINWLHIALLSYTIP